ncbi:hypothetical protein LJC27_00250 [Christensenellaceae bacterium OttesenSCG-928-M15]|nr:hypothetical protein [Christensenellaceae bacterium OttesenSCG-928-M15]
MINRTISIRGVAVVFICFIVMALLCACDQGQQVSGEAEDTPSPEWIEETGDQIEQTPPAENPVWIFYTGFEDVYQRLYEAVGQAAKEDIRHLDKSLALASIHQKLQFFFLGLSELTYIEIEEEAAWTGSMLGAVPGTGTIRDEEGEYTLSCTLGDRSRITGFLRENRMEAEWKRAEDVLVTPEPKEWEEPPIEPEWQTEYHTEKTAKLWYDGSAYHVVIFADEEYFRLQVDDENLYCVMGTEDMQDERAANAQWAAWGFENGRFIEYLEAADEQ